MKNIINSRFLAKLLATRRGRAFMFGFMADAEEADEGKVFEALRTRVDDERLQQLVTKHGADEERHAALLKAEIARLGVPVEHAPEELKFVGRLDAKLGGLAQRFIEGEADVAEIYTMLGVMEERAVREWPNIVRALEPIDPQAAATIAGIIEDEKRHVKYARAVARQYASPERLAQLDREYRAIEEKEFAAQGNDFLRFIVERDLLDVGPVERTMWRVLVGLQHTVMQLMPDSGTTA